MHFLLGLNAKLKTLIDRLTSTRAGYFDNLPIIKTCTDRLTSTRATYIDYINTINSRVTAAVATATALQTVDDNVDALNSGQDLYEITGLVSAGAGKTQLLSISGAGNLVYVGIGCGLATSMSATDLHVKTDGGTERTIDLNYTSATAFYNDNNANIQLGINLRFKTALIVSLTPGASTDMRYFILYAKDK